MTKVIQMYAGAKVKDFVQSRALKICVLVDFLRGIYLARHSKTYLVDKSDFDRLVKPLKTEVRKVLLDLFSDVSSEHLEMMTNHVQGFVWYPFRRSIKELCENICLEVSSQEIHRFVIQRNELTHRGSFFEEANGKAQHLEDIYREMMTFAGKIVLAILEYDGWYYDWTKPPGWLGDSEMRVKMPNRPSSVKE
jgi:hypothetical protein